MKTQHIVTACKLSEIFPYEKVMACYGHISSKARTDEKAIASNNSYISNSMNKKHPAFRAHIGHFMQKFPFLKREFIVLGKFDDLDEAEVCRDNWLLEMKNKGYNVLNSKVKG